MIWLSDGRAEPCPLLQSHPRTPGDGQTLSIRPPTSQLSLWETAPSFHDHERKAGRRLRPLPNLVN
jgi:hypothetical protein